MMEPETKRPLAEPEREDLAVELFSLNISPEEYAARHGADWASFSFAEYRYRDAQLDEWIQRLGTIFFTPGRLRECQEAVLTPEELRRIREREQEEF